jgi:hypothetical protein
LGETSFRESIHDATVPHPSIDEKGMTTIRLQRLHFSSIPCPCTLAISWPHSQRVSLFRQASEFEAFVVTM